MVVYCAARRAAARARHAGAGSGVLPAAVKQAGCHAAAATLLASYGCGGWLWRYGAARMRLLQAKAFARRLPYITGIYADDYCQRPFRLL